jgi:hypothetical protein
MKGYQQWYRLTDEGEWEQCEGGEVFESTFFYADWIGPTGIDWLTDEIRFRRDVIIYWGRKIIARIF